MAEYEAVWEIYNQCSNNQMRDVLIEEIETEDVDEYIRRKFKGKDLSYDRQELEDGTVVYNIIASGMKQRYSFTPI